MRKTSISHRQRIETVLSGAVPDRVPVALWRHFPVDDQLPGSLAAATIQFQREYDFDLIKVTPASSFCLKDWGFDDQWRGDPEGVRTATVYPIHDSDDLTKLKVLPSSARHLAAQLECLSLITKEFVPHTPVIQTIFSPLSQARKLIGNDHFAIHLRKYPGAMHSALEVITETTIHFVEKAIQTGIDGVFYAVQQARYAQLSELEFEEFGQRYDLRVLDTVRSLWLNFVHIHGSEIMFNQIQDYPAAVLNWHDQETYPSLATGQSLFAGTVCGGLRQWETLVNSSPTEVNKEAMAAIKETKGTRFILGTGCVLPTTAPRGNILAARESVERKML